MSDYWTNLDLQKKVNALIFISIEDMRSSLNFVTSVKLLEVALDQCKERGYKTKTRMLETKIKALKKELEEKKKKFDYIRNIGG